MVHIKKDTSKFDDLNNFRPISLLCCVSKILEKFFTKRLEDEVEERGLISRNQFAFRRGMGTNHAISRLMDLIHDCRSQGRIAGVVFVDFKKAFDSVNHRLLIERLKTLGINEQVVNFFHSFLADRTFVGSKTMRGIRDVDELQDVVGHRVQRGVLQGSISGPILFSLFIEQLIPVVRGPVVFADDFTFVIGGEFVDQLKAELEHDFKWLHKAASEINLQMNMAKTKVMLFRSDIRAYDGTKAQQIRDFCIEIPAFMGGGKIERVESFKYLGCTIDHLYKFNLHVDNVVNAASRVYRSVERVLKLKGLEESRRVWVYKTLIRPILVYACPVWVLLTPALMEKITNCEYHILRSLFGQYRKSNGHYVSYRSRLIKARLPGVDYQIIKLARRHLMRLDGTELARVNQDAPNWSMEVSCIKKRLFTAETTMFADAMGLLLDAEGNMVWYSLDRHGLAKDFNLEDALNREGEQRRYRVPTEYDLKSAKSVDGKWKSWVVPQQYSGRLNRGPDGHRPSTL